jgi:hypothetical protein
VADSVPSDPYSSPGTAPFVPDFGDTGEESVPFVPNFDDDSEPLESLPRVTESEKPGKSEPNEEFKATEPAAEQDSATESAAVPVSVPGRYQYLKWWKLVLVLLGVWFAAGEVGLSLFYWWYHTNDKTAAVFMVAVYVVTCVVAGVMLAMVQGRPTISALALAVTSGPFASLAAAAPLYGYYYCERVGRCLVGVIPY